MAEPYWQASTRIKVPAVARYGCWTHAIDYVDASRWLRFIVEDVPDPASTAAPPTKMSPRWNYSASNSCTADGDLGATTPDPAKCLCPTAPPGALIAKIGGSSAGRSDGPIFVVGSLCLYALDDKTRVALYLGINTDPSRPPNGSGTLDVTVSVGM